MITLTLSVNQTITLTLNPQSFAGNIGRIKGITWKTISGNSTVVPSEDGMTAVITANSTPGVTIFEVGANTNMKLKSPTSPVIPFQFPPISPPTLIFNHISVNVVQNRIDSTQGSTTTNLGVSVGSPRDQV